VPGGRSKPANRAVATGGTGLAEVTRLMRPDATLWRGRDGKQAGRQAGILGCAVPGTVRPRRISRSSMGGLQPMARRR
jgi:hypothetical protein